MKHGGSGRDVTSAAWAEGLIGIWYGAWSANDLKALSGESAASAAAKLSKLKSQVRLNWPVKPSFVATSRRFEAIQPDDYIFTYFDSKLHIAKPAGPILNQRFPRFDERGDRFKARRIEEKRKFNISDLPEPFQLLAWAGRGNVHRVLGTRSLVDILSNCSTVSCVNEAFSKLSWEDWLKCLGPKGWETLCLGYLIETCDFLPTGLGMGDTLPNFDIVGRRRGGRLILAQCKKSPYEIALSHETLEAFSNSKQADRYLFALKGCSNTPRDIKLLTGADLCSWFEKTKKGKRYRALIFGS
jgi:hypothetical protein